MLGKRRSTWVLRLLAADLLVLLVSFVLAHKLRVLLDYPFGRAAAPLRHYLWLLELILPVWVGLLAALGAYGVRWTTRSRAWLTLRVAAIGLVLLTAALFLVKESERSGSSAAWFSRGSVARVMVTAGLTWRWWWAPTSG
jgi:hypothetical protein